MVNMNARSLLSRLYIKGKIERIGLGIYKIKGDTRKYNPNMPHYSK
jgi:predicted transcriptional regulator of viral defense system